MSKLRARKTNWPKFTELSDFVTWVGEEPQRLLKSIRLWESHQLSYTSCPIPSQISHGKFQWEQRQMKVIGYTHEGWCGHWDAWAFTRGIFIFRRKYLQHLTKYFAWDLRGSENTKLCLCSYVTKNQERCSPCACVLLRGRLMALSRQPPHPTFDPRGWWRMS